MNLLDVLILVVAVAAAVGGYRLGFVTRVLSWAAMFLGLLLSVRLLPWLLEQLPEGDQTLTLVVAVGTVFAGSFLGQALGFALGARLRPEQDEDGGVTTLDGVAGAAAGVLGVVLAVWLLLPVLSEASGWLGRQVRTSEIVQAVDTRFPDPPDAVQTLRSFVGEDTFPQVFEDLQPTPDVGPPPAETGLTPAQGATITRSVVMVEGEACGRIQDGTGWVVERGLVLTNAHVVAGERTTEIIRDDGQRLPADVVTFDPNRDLALLAVTGLNRPALALDDAAVGDVGAVFGHPGGGQLRIAPAAVARHILATGRDIYGAAGAERQVLELATALAPGDSGAPLVGQAGEVIGVVFAIATDEPEVAYALATSEVEAVLDAPRSAETATGPCIR